MKLMIRRKWLLHTSNTKIRFAGIGADGYEMESRSRYTPDGISVVLSIMTSILRKPETIAREIRERLLADYQPKFEQRIHGYRFSRDERKGKVAYAPAYERALFWLQEYVQREHPST